MRESRESPFPVLKQGTGTRHFPHLKNLSTILSDLLLNMTAYPTSEYGM